MGDMVRVLLNPGNGAFTGAIDYPGPSFTNVIVAADMNGDGLPDLVANKEAKSSVTVMLNVGNGAFGLPTRHDSAGNTRSIAVTDLNGDGRPDVVSANTDESAVGVLLNICSP